MWRLDSVPLCHKGRKALCRREGSESAWVGDSMGYPNHSCLPAADVQLCILTMHTDSSDCVVAACMHAHLVVIVPPPAILSQCILAITHLWQASCSVQGLAILEQWVRVQP